MSKTITTEGHVIDGFTAAGLPKPDISILSDQFLAEVRGLKHKNIAAELMEKLLQDELKALPPRAESRAKPGLLSAANDNVNSLVAAFG